MQPSIQSIIVAINKAFDNLTVESPADGVSKEFEKQRAFDNINELRNLLQKVASFNPDNLSDVKEFNKKQELADFVPSDEVIEKVKEILNTQSKGEEANAAISRKKR